MDLQTNWELEALRNPYIDRLGVIRESAAPDCVRISKAVGPEDLDADGTAAGGILFSLADEACGTLLDVQGIPSVTLNAAFQFLAPAREGSRLTAEARFLPSQGPARVCEARIALQDGRLAAAGTFTVYPLR